MGKEIERKIHSCYMREMNWDKYKVIHFAYENKN